MCTKASSCRAKNQKRLNHKSSASTLSNESIELLEISYFRFRKHTLEFRE